MTPRLGTNAFRACLPVLLWLGASPAHAQWQPNGIPIATASGAQEDARIASDREGGAIVVWIDLRTYDATQTDIYAQHVTAKGRIAPGWPAEGFPVCTDPAYQYDPKVIPDGAGGAYMTWIDARFGILDIYLQRLTAAGAIAPGWTPNGIRVCPSPGYQDAPKLVPDGAGGVFVVWEDYRRGDPYGPIGQVDISAQRIL